MKNLILFIFIYLMNVLLNKFHFEECNKIWELKKYKFLKLFYNSIKKYNRIHLQSFEYYYKFIVKDYYYFVSKKHIYNIEELSNELKLIPKHYKKIKLAEYNLSNLEFKYIENCINNSVEINDFNFIDLSEHPELTFKFITDNLDKYWSIESIFSNLFIIEYCRHIKKYITNYVKKIQIYWDICRYNPSYKICQNFIIESYNSLFNKDNKIYL